MTRWPAEFPEEGSGSRPIEITVVVVPGRIRTMATRLIAVRRVRVVLVAAAVLALVGGAGVVVAVVSGTSTARPPLWAQALAADSHLKGLGNPLFTRFRIQWSCPRVTAVSSGGTYVRVDFEHTGHCGVYGNTVALVLRRSHDAWWPKFEASTWTCPIRALPVRVAAQLGLCEPRLGPAGRG